MEYFRHTFVSGALGWTRHRDPADVPRPSAARGVEVLLVATDEGLRRVESSRAMDYEDVPAIFFRCNSANRSNTRRPLSVWLKANVNHFDLAHIHAVFNHAPIAAARECRKARVPYVIRPLGTLDPWSMKRSRCASEVFWSLAGEKMLSSASAVHYTSQAEQTATEGLLGVNHGCVIPLGIDPIPGSTNGVHKDPYVLVLSRLHPKKGLDVPDRRFHRAHATARI